MPLCTVVTAGCDGLEPPQFSDQVAGSDVFGACNDVYNCASGGDGTGPFYHGIFTENGLAYCFYKEVIENSACNGSGACQSKAQACLDAGRGEPVNSRPQCETPLSGCTDTAGPIYGPVEQFQDPYSDCAGPEGAVWMHLERASVARSKAQPAALIQSVPRDSRVLKVFVVMVAVILHASHVSHR